MIPIRHFAADATRRRAPSSSRRRARARSARSTSRRAARSFAASTARRSRSTSRCSVRRDADAVLRAHVGDARRRGLSAAPAARSALLHDDAFVRAVRATRASRVLFVHALNPYGFSHGRRVNEDNVDLNRNFRDFATPPPRNAAYAEVHPFCCRRRGRRRRRTKRSDRRVRRGARRARVPGGGHRRPVRVSRRPFLRRRARRRGATGRCARCCARHASRRAALALDRLSHRPRTARAWREDLRGPRRSPPTSRAPGRGGATT